MIRYHKWRIYDRLAIDLTIILGQILRYFVNPTPNRNRYKLLFLVIIIIITSYIDSLSDLQCGALFTHVREIKFARFVF